MSPNVDYVYILAEIISIQDPPQTCLLQGIEISEVQQGSPYCVFLLNKTKKKENLHCTLLQAKPKSETTVRVTGLGGVS